MILQSAHVAPENEMQITNITPAAAPMPAVQVREVGQIVVSTGNDEANCFSVVVAIKQGDQTTIVYSNRHTANGDSVGVADLPAALASQASKGAGVPCGWIQFIDGVQSQNFCRDEAELKGCKDIAEIFAKGKQVEYVQVFRAPSPAQAQPVASQRPSDDDLWDQTLRERDYNAEIADKLADAIGEHLGRDVGEHSSGHCPWLAALEMLNEAQPVADAAPDREGLYGVLTDEDIVAALHSLAIDTFPSAYGFPEVQVSGTNVPSIRRIVARCNRIIADKERSALAAKPAEPK